MSIFLVAYELQVPDQEPSKISALLTGFDHYRAHQALWFIDAVGPADQLRDALSEFLYPNDKLFVDQISESWAGWNLKKGAMWLTGKGY